MTEIPILPNSSFNEDEPLVGKPQEAMEHFLRPGIFVLAMGDRSIECKG
jgi:predicted NodU family carbamoyl transferase